MGRVLVLISVVIFSMFSNPSAQVKIISEELSGSKYVIHASEEFSNFYISKSNGLARLILPDYEDESFQGSFQKPYRDFFIALPTNSSPEISINVLKWEELQAVPMLNKNVVQSSSGKLEYTSSDVIFDQENNRKLVNGFLWIEDNYCAHLCYPLVEFDKEQRMVRIPREFEVTINFSNKIPQQKEITQTPDVYDLVLNKSNAALWKSDRVMEYSINNEWIDYDAVYVKLGTSADDIYTITYNDLQSYIPNIAGINPKTFRLICGGEEIPIFVQGENDLSFNDYDYIEFVGTKYYGNRHREISEYDMPYNEYLNRYTDTKIYWLTWGGDEGVRVKSYGPSYSATTDTLTFYHEVLHVEENPWYDFSCNNIVRRELPYWSENKTWGWRSVGTGGQNFTFSISDLYTGDSVYFYSKFQSYASNLFTDAHLAAMALNSNIVRKDSTLIDRYEQVVLSGAYGSGVLNNGNNTFNLYNYANGSNPNQVYFDWYEIEYPRYLNAINDSLKFSFKNFGDVINRSIEIENLTSDSYRIWRFGDKYKKFESGIIRDSLIFCDTVKSTAKYIIKERNEVSKPIFYYSKKFNRLADAGEQIDYIAISHKNFSADVDDYLSFIEASYQLSAKYIDVEDIYDEFCYGYPFPESIRSFLMMANQEWPEPEPQYVILIGAANYDYHKYKTTFLGEPAKENYVPSYGAPVSDNWYVIWDTTGAYLPQMNIGRLPIFTSEELQWYKAKHQEYISNEYSLWNKTFIFFSGGLGNNQSEIEQLKNVNENITQKYIAVPPIGGKYKHFYKTLNPSTNFGPVTQTEFNETISEGAIFISYLGHSGTRIWDNSITEPDQLNNSINRYPLLTDFGCSTARFAEPDVYSFSQLFVLSNSGQAISYIGNSSLGFISTSTTAPEYFYKNILLNSYHNIGQALIKAKEDYLTQYGFSDVYKLFALTNTLIGDPVIELPIPEKPNLVIFNETDIHFYDENLTDNIDTTSIRVFINNYGLVTSDSVSVLVEQFYGDEKCYELFSKIEIPLLQDSIVARIPVRDKPGLHRLVINIDQENDIDEIYEDDNEAIIEFLVASSNVKKLSPYLHETAFADSLVLINPTVKPAREYMELQISGSADFQNITEQKNQFGDFYTKFDITNLQSQKRFWFRSRIEGDPFFSLPGSFFNSGDINYSLNDSVSFGSGSFENTSYTANTGIKLDSTQIVLEVKSAGWSDGNVAVISKNFLNYLPFTSRGHNVVVLRDTTFEYLSYRVFDLLFGGATAQQNYMNFIDTLGTDKLVLIAVADEGRVSSAELRGKIKLLGSALIDSLKFRGSWALIGKKGAAQGSVPEGFTDPYSGAVVIDTTISVQNQSGMFETSLIGPSAKWKKLFIQDSLHENIDYELILLNRPDVSDTAAVVTINNQMDLSAIDGKTYPYIKVRSDFSEGENRLSPILKRLDVSYASLPELGTNYQVAWLDQDTLQQGEVVNLSFYVYNVGESAADSFKVKVDLINADNSREKIFEQVVDSIGARQRKLFEVDLNTSAGSGAKSFFINIDSENSVSELYDDNNYYTIPFNVQPDTTRPTLNLTFDGIDIFDGDYISNNPVIKIEISDESLVAITDTTAVQLYLNNQPVYHSQNLDRMNYTYANTNPKFTLEYRPQLEDGEYILKVIGQDAVGNMVDSSGITKSFIVENDAKLLYVYNYPNPFVDETYFTFKLTQIPDELQIKIFTIAGRLIKEIEKYSGDLNTDFNRIHWDGRDEDGDPIANGVYLYKVIITKDGQTQNVTQKMAIIR